ncbi:MAG: response regulator transcription factor [Bacteroidota bacterium]
MSDKRILIVEDEKMTARLLVYRLKALGHDVTHIDDGSDALEWILKEKPDLLVLDVMLPGLSGFEILENLQESGELTDGKLDVIMLTTKNRSEDISRGFNLGAMEYISKPFKMDEFLLRMNRLLEPTDS